MPADGALPLDDYEPEFFAIYHGMGRRDLRATFACANDAKAFMDGLKGVRSGDLFHIENEKGQPVTFAETRPGHAYAILDALNRAGR